VLLLREWHDFCGNFSSIEEVLTRGLPPEASKEKLAKSGGKLTKKRAICVVATRPKTRPPLHTFSYTRHSKRKNGTIDTLPRTQHKQATRQNPKQPLRH